MKYERLTFNKDYYGDTIDFNDIYKRLAELEDKIENGTLVELPCKIGDIFYCIRFSSVKEEQVTEITTEDGESWCVYDTLGEWHELDEIYFTKAEAEKQLEELKENKNGN